MNNKRLTLKGGRLKKPPVRFLLCRESGQYIQSEQTILEYIIYKKFSINLDNNRRKEEQRRRNKKK